MIYLTTEEIIAINARHLGGQAAVRDAGLVASAATRPATEVFGTELFSDVFEKAAALLHSLICTHPFLDANKRTGWAAMRIFLKVNRVVFDVPEDTAFDLVVWVAESCTSIEVKDIATRLTEARR